MVHTLNVEVAVKLGQKEALLIEYIGSEIKINKRRNENFRNGYYWIRHKLSDFEKIFPYWSLKQIRLVLKRLEEKEVIRAGFYNEDPLDRSKWYTIVDKEISTQI